MTDFFSVFLTLVADFLARDPVEGDDLVNLIAVLVNGAER